MAAPRPPSPTLDDVLIPPSPVRRSPSIVDIFPDCPEFFTNGRPIFAPPPIFPLAPPVVRLPESRGRSRTRSPSPRPFICGNANLFIPPPTLSDYSPTRSYSPSPPPRHRHRCYRRSSRTPSPIRPPYSYPSPQVIITQAPPAPPPPIQIMPAPSPSPVLWPPAPGPSEPVDILTFHYNTNMAYAPTVKSYDVRFPPSRASCSV
jgi:hypothetical protein